MESPLLALLCLAGVAIFALVIYDARFRQLDEALVPGDRVRILARAAIEAVGLMAITAGSPFALVGLGLGALAILLALLADLGVGRQQEADLSRAGATPMAYTPRPPIMLMA